MLIFKKMLSIFEFLKIHLFQALSVKTSDKFPTFDILKSFIDF
jgi:hypothetical protein